jgi:hypothetical protein
MKRASFIPFWWSTKVRLAYRTATKGIIDAFISHLQTRNLVQAYITVASFHHWLFIQYKYGRCFYMVFMIIMLGSFRRWVAVIHAMTCCNRSAESSSIRPLSAKLVRLIPEYSGSVVAELWALVTPRSRHWCFVFSFCSCLQGVEAAGFLRIMLVDVFTVVICVVPKVLGFLQLGSNRIKGNR